MGANGKKGLVFVRAEFWCVWEDKRGGEGGGENAPGKAGWFLYDNLSASKRKRGILTESKPNEKMKHTVKQRKT